MTGTDASGDGNRAGGSRDVRTVASTLGVLVLVAVVLPFVVFAVPQLVGAQQSYVVLSGSMEPAISPGDAILVESVDPAAVEQGDVVTFGGDGRPTTHRVIEVVEQEDGVAFRTKGDNNEDPDQALVSPGELRGRVPSVGGHLVVIPYIGYVVQFAGTRTGYVLLVAVPLTLLVASEVWNFVGATRARSDDDDRAETDREDEWNTPDDAEGGAGTAGGVTVEGDRDGYVLTTADDIAGGGDDAEISLRATELELGLGVLTAFTAYSLWVAYSTTEVWSIGVAGSAVVGLVMLAGLYWFGGTTEERRRRSAVDGGRRQVPVARGAPPDGAPDETQPVAAFGTLVELAEGMRRPIHRDPGAERQYVAGESARYVHEGSPGDGWDWPAVDETGESTDEADEQADDGGAWDRQGADGTDEPADAAEGP